MGFLNEQEIKLTKERLAEAFRIVKERMEQCILEELEKRLKEGEGENVCANTNK